MVEESIKIRYEWDDEEGNKIFKIEKFYLPFFLNGLGALIRWFVRLAVDCIRTHIYLFTITILLSKKFVYLT